jgi:hypothetical protein
VGVVVGSVTLEGELWKHSPTALADHVKAEVGRVPIRKDETEIFKVVWTGCRSHNGEGTLDLSLVAKLARPPAVISSLIRSLDLSCECTGIRR